MVVGHLLQRSNSKLQLWLAQSGRLGGDFLNKLRYLKHANGNGNQASFGYPVFNGTGQIVVG